MTSTQPLPSRRRPPEEDEEEEGFQSGTKPSDASVKSADAEPERLAATRQVGGASGASSVKPNRDTVNTERLNR
ncbi:hypothetical protein OJAV_G00072280 [Oryzias javanicus]|uniref:Uncharacterized protein n=1 Tax=Oryzias javanicus TaxID=123683 RepID=A0A3S2N179_ORYJA|nr:hypothetical protein OJAV_G00072280 [Oryzias javanicus]